MKDIEQPHDAVFKSSLTCIVVAQKFFETHLPQNVLDLVNLDTLSLDKENFVTNELQRYSSDIIYKVNFKKSLASKEFIYLLIEHESTVNAIMLLRVHNYLNLIIQQHLKQTKNIKKLPLAFAVIYYTGQKSYIKPHKFFNKFADVSLAKQLFNVPYKLVAINMFSDQEIIKKHKTINLLEFAQKHIYTKDFFMHNNQLKMLLKNTNILEYKQAILKYLSVAANVSDKQKFYEQLKIYAKLLGAKGEKFMGTLAEYWFEDGMQQGLEQGLEQGRDLGLQQGLDIGKQKSALDIATRMLKAKLDVSMVAKFTGLKRAELKHLI